MTLILRFLIIFLFAVNLDGQIKKSGGGVGGAGGGGGGGATSLSGLTDLRVTKTSDTAASVATGQNSIGGKVSDYTLTATIALSGAVSSSDVYVYIANDGVLTAGHNGATTVTCTNCTTATGITEFPFGSRPLAIVPYVSNVFGTPVNKRVLSYQFVPTNGSGIAITQNAGGDYVFTNTNTKIQHDEYFGSGGILASGTGVFNPIICDSTAGCIADVLTAGNRQWPVTAYTNTGTTLSGSIYYRIPDNWDEGPMSLILNWTRGAGSGTNVVWSVQTACVGNNETVSTTTYNGAQTVTTAPAGVPERVESVIPNLTLTGCAKNEHLIVQIARASGNASDDLAATVFLVGVTLRHKRNLTN